VESQVLLSTQQIGLRQPNVFEKQFRRILTLHSYLLEVATAAKSFHAFDIWYQFCGKKYPHHVAQQQTFLCNTRCIVMESQIVVGIFR